MIKTTAFLTFIILGLSTSANAEEQTVKLSIPDMSCASCPYMVKNVISKLEGIVSVEATMQDRSATVVYNDETVDVKMIQEATKSIGYPSEIFDEAIKS